MLDDSHPIFVIGDIHGCSVELDLLLDRLPLGGECSVVLIGDYIDRGPSAKDVVDRLLKLRQEAKVFALMGNHEASLCEFVESPESPEAARFLYNGGGATLASYSNRPGEFDIPEDHLAFFRDLPVIGQSEQFVFVHAGLPDVRVAELDPETHRRDFLWIRHTFLESDFRWGKVVVHGHTPCHEVTLGGSRINVDTGCVFSRKLSAVELKSGKIYEVPRQTENPTRFLQAPAWSRRRAVRFNGQITVTLFGRGVNVRFRTVNYNEFGVLLEASRHLATHRLCIGDRVRGAVEPTADEAFHFEGEVVREERTTEVFRYAIKFDRPPVRKNGEP
jgi:serine/threonine protein phosphatase 1